MSGERILLKVRSGDVARVLGVQKETVLKNVRSGRWRLESLEDLLLLCVPWGELGREMFSGVERVRGRFVSED